MKVVFALSDPMFRVCKGGVNLILYFVVIIINISFNKATKLDAI